MSAEYGVSRFAPALHKRDSRSFRAAAMLRINRAIDRIARAPAGWNNIPDAATVVFCAFPYEKRACND
jgi:hypothetical protein